MSMFRSPLSPSQMAAERKTSAMTVSGNSPLSDELETLCRRFEVCGARSGP